MVRGLAKRREITETLKRVMMIPFFASKGHLQMKQYESLTGAVKLTRFQLCWDIYSTPLNRACLMQFIIFSKHVVFAYNTK